MRPRQPDREGAVRWRGATVASVFDQLLPETHPTRQYEDAVGWALDTDTDTDTESMIAAREGQDVPAGADAESLCAQPLCPTLVVHGTENRCQPLARRRRQAELTGGERGRTARLRGTYRTPGTRSRSSDSSPSSSSGITGFAMRTTTWTRALSRPKRALYLSSPIGLGHARRDVAIAKELTRLRPDLEIDWLAQHPVTSVLEA